MLKTLKLNGNHMFAFTSVPNKGIIDLTPPISKSFKPMNWKDLKGKVINNKNIILSRYGDIHPFSNGPVFNCENLIMEGCDKNFVYYWMNQQTFPNAKNVYLNSHPCDYDVLGRQFKNIYLHESYSRYKERWGGKNVKVISDKDYESLINTYEEASEEIQVILNKE